MRSSPLLPSSSSQSSGCDRGEGMTASGPHRSRRAFLSGAAAFTDGFAGLSARPGVVGAAELAEMPLIRSGQSVSSRPCSVCAWASILAKSSTTARISTVKA